MKDPIERQDAIDAVAEELSRINIHVQNVAIARIQDKLNKLPSAPTEIIWCKNCKNWYAYTDKQFGYCRRECWEDDGQYRLKVETTQDDYCSYAERRTDE